MVLFIVNHLHRLMRPICPKGTLRGHLWFAVDRLLQTWANRGLYRALRAVWDRRVSPLYRRHPDVPDNIFVARDVRTHTHRIGPHSASAEIIVCVHNALEDVKICLSSVIRHTRPPYRILIVDDGSADETREFLAQWTHEQGVQRIRHEQARGYTCAANAGLRASTADLVVLLNSDTQVTPLWLDRMAACAGSDPRIGLVGPLSNAASWQSVPAILDANGDWHENPLPADCSLNEWALLIGRQSAYAYPQVPFLNGFCLMIKRTVLEQVGLFDEKHFGRGYGEENDYAVRVRHAGWSLVIADDAYVQHRQSRSYSHEKRKRLATEAQDTLNRLHGPDTFTKGCGILLSDRTLLSIRARSAVLWEQAQCIRTGRKRHEGRRVLFILPTARPGGGSHVIVQEARAMQQMGVDVRLFNFSMNKQDFQDAYPEITVPVLYGRDLDDLYGLLPDFDAVVATLFSSVNWIHPEKAGAPDVVRGYYIQDYEPWFFKPDSPEHEEAVASYGRIPGMVRLTKTEWNRRTVLDETGLDGHVVGPGVDLELFAPRQIQRQAGTIHLIAMIRPETERRNPEMTLRVLSRLKARFADRLAVTLFGCEPDAPLCRRYAGLLPHRHLGIITRTELAAELPAMDIFVDFSTYQAMGLTAMEAMACGVAVVVPRRGGTEAFAEHGVNAWCVDTESEADCQAGVAKLIADAGLLQTLQARALADICSHDPAKPALRILDALFAQPPTGEEASR